MVVFCPQHLFPNKNPFFRITTFFSLPLIYLFPLPLWEKPLKDAFVRHSRTLLATGSSTKSVRAQLFVNAAFFLSGNNYEGFKAAMPELPWFQAQRERLGNECMLYTFMSIAMCEEVCRWGFDETSLNGIPTLNQWCRIKEGSTYRTLTIECAGLLPGSTSSRVAAHVWVLWRRGQEAVAMLREELGEMADVFIPLVAGGVTMANARGVMHDTCNYENLIAKKVRGIRDDVGKEMYGAEEWAAMQESGSGWQDFLCGSHSRNLHFDAFNRLFTTFMKGLLGEAMAVAKMKSGGRLWVEADGESFVRSICKLTHVGAKQYEKCKRSITPIFPTNSCPSTLRDRLHFSCCRRWHPIQGLL
jgi:hypothetical protein